MVDPTDVRRQRVAELVADFPVEGGRTGGQRTAGRDRGGQRDHSAGSPPGHEGRESGEERGHERDGERSVPGGDRRFEPQDGPECRRVVFPVGSGIAGEWNPRGEEQQGRGDRSDHELSGHAALAVQAEGDCEQGHEREDVARLKAP